MTDESRKWNGSTPGGPKNPILTEAPASDTLEDHLRIVFADSLGYDVEVITRESRLLEDLNADSLDLVELCCAIEDATGLIIPDEQDPDDLKTFHDWVTYCEQLPKPRKRAKATV